MNDDGAFNDFVARLGSLEDMVMSNLPRIASTEFRADGIVKSVASMEARLDRELQRRRLAAEMHETTVPTQQPIPSHRGLGAVAPAPSPACRGAFSEALAARTTPLSSVTITAEMAVDAPLWMDTGEPTHDEYDISTPIGNIQSMLARLEETDVKIRDAERNTKLTQDRLHGLTTVIAAFASECSNRFEDIKNDINNVASLAKPASPPRAMLEGSPPPHALTHAHGA